MKRIIFCFLFVFLFSGIVYSKNWGQYWVTIPQDHEDGSLTITKKKDNTYDIQLYYQEDSRERNPLDCGDSSKHYLGKEVNNEILVYRNNDLRFKIVPKGNTLEVIPELNGKNKFYCGDSEYTKKDFKNDFEKNRNLFKNNFKKLKWKETN